jgi:hypothetical protein
MDESVQEQAIIGEEIRENAEIRGILG